ncbi:MAG: 1-acyl-sn-glycerol-3-phosphate acyltransferase [Thermomonas sp.]|uniref:lysophospholipid acyltransferase family protein n=1 Tax=Thermomonas sp. TaxID=1971895 RepID=UPI001ED5DF4C|nr:lysophospholipid acyltransferase family protein [Thermomonas sp.]MBV2209030.1 1-acyl-sn-glycerol-3-phosphate acyltransferase [Thermomonas sp.]
MSGVAASGLWVYCSRFWRVLATGLSFLAFGIGGVLLGVLAFPLIDLFVLDRIVRRRWSRRLVQISFAFHFELMRRLGVLTYEVRGRERLARNGLLILANHPTLIDVVLLVSLLPNADCVVKSSLARNLFTRGPVRAAGYVCNDDSVGLIDDCIAAVRRGGNLVIFPEGTRSSRQGPLRLQRGAANIAIRGRLDITPIRLSCSPMTLGKGEQWYNVPLRRFHIIAEVGHDIAVAPYLDDARGEAMAARRLTEDLANYFRDGTLRASS